MFGGGIIPESDHDSLFSSGIRAIFGPGTPVDEILTFITEAIKLNLDGDVGCGGNSSWHWS